MPDIRIILSLSLLTACCAEPEPVPSTTQAVVALSEAFCEWRECSAVPAYRECRTAMIQDLCAAWDCTTPYPAYSVDDLHACLDALHALVCQMPDQRLPAPCLNVIRY